MAQKKPTFPPGHPMFWQETQAFMQGYQGEHFRNLEQLSFGVAQADIDTTEEFFGQMKTVGTAPPVTVGNLNNPNDPAVEMTDIKMQYLQLPLRRLLELAKHPEAYVRSRLALVLGPEKRHERPFMLLAKDPAHLVRRTVGQNMWCMSKVLRAMADDSDVWVRRRVVYHRNATIPIIKVMLNDPDGWVRAIAQHVLLRERKSA